MLQGTYTLDTEDMDEAHASFEMRNFRLALKIPVAATTGKPGPKMGT